MERYPCGQEPTNSPEYIKKTLREVLQKLIDYTKSMKPEDICPFDGCTTKDDFINKMRNKLNIRTKSAPCASQGASEESPPIEQKPSRQPPHKRRQIPQGPPRQPVYAAPPRQQVHTAPPRQQVYTAPPRQQVYTAPPRQQVYAAPPRQPVYEAPPPQEDAPRVTFEDNVSRSPQPIKEDEYDYPSKTDSQDESEDEEELEVKKTPSPIKQVKEDKLEISPDEDDTDSDEEEEEDEEEEDEKGITGENKDDEQDPTKNKKPDIDRISSTDSELILKMQNLRARLEKFEEMHQKFKDREGIKLNIKENVPIDPYSEAIAPLISIVLLQEGDNSSESTKISIHDENNEKNTLENFNTVSLSTDSSDSNTLENDGQIRKSNKFDDQTGVIPCDLCFNNKSPWCEYGFPSDKAIDIQTWKELYYFLKFPKIRTEVPMHQPSKKLVPNRENIYENKLKVFVSDVIELSMQSIAKILDDRDNLCDQEECQCPCVEDILTNEDIQVLSIILEKLLDHVFTCSEGTSPIEKLEQKLIKISQILGSATSQEFEKLIVEINKAIDTTKKVNLNKEISLIGQSFIIKNRESDRDEKQHKSEDIQNGEKLSEKQEEMGNENVIIADILGTGINERAIQTECVDEEDEWISPRAPRESMKGLTYKQLHNQTESWFQEFKEYCEIFNRQVNFVVKNDFTLANNREKIESLNQLLEKSHFGIENLEKLIRDEEDIENECLSTHCMYLNTEIKGRGDREIMYRSILQIKQNLNDSAKQIELINDYIKEKVESSPVMKITRILNCYANTLEAAEYKIQQIEHELPKVKHLRDVLLARKPVL